ncbi:hypothetical protein Anas_01344 [Armadillidium nasatum]|uniref:Tudor domain-containing protein n=1 Tax=Armadillidium nasatum TaxID=96803 RepID=A0A5N5SVI9_9CRUS|nr:hypothetical protein Anas_01344 [Armadillidium nasatum]
MFYPKIRLDNSQITKTIKASILSEVSENFKEEVEGNCVWDEPYVTFQIDYFKNVLTFPIEVGEVYSTSNFYVLIKSFSSKLDELTLEMENFYLRNGNMSRWTIKNPDILFEQLVAVYYEEENTFYRGTIITISGVDNVQVVLYNILNITLKTKVFS